MKLFEKRLRLKDQQAGEVALVTVTPDMHMNLCVDDKDTPSYAAVTMSKSEAIQLRDALNEVYPVEAEKPPYVVQRNVQEFEERWDIGRNVPYSYFTRLASASSEADAKKFAKALNEAEGL